MVLSGYVRNLFLESFVEANMDYVKGAVSNFFLTSTKCLYYLADMTEIAVVRNHSCICDSPRLCKHKKASGEQQVLFSPSEKQSF